MTLNFTMTHSMHNRPHGCTVLHSIGRLRTTGIAMSFGRISEGAWVLMKDPGSNAVRPVYIEPRIIVLPFRLSEGVASTRRSNLSPNSLFLLEQPGILY